MWNCWISSEECKCQFREVVLIWLMMFLLWVKVLFAFKKCVWFLTLSIPLAFSVCLHKQSLWFCLLYSFTLYLFLPVLVTPALWNVLICEIKLQFLKPGDSNLGLAQGQPLSARLSLTGLRQTPMYSIVYEEFYRDRLMVIWGLRCL